MRRILGVLSLTKKYGCAACEQACAAALEFGATEYRFVRRYLDLDRTPAAPLSLLAKSIPSSANWSSIATRGPRRQVFVAGVEPSFSKECNSSSPPNEHDRTRSRPCAQLRLSSMADVLETRLLQAQANAMAPIDLLSSLVSDELACRRQRLLERRHKQAQFRDPNKHLDNFDFQFNPRTNRNLIFDLATAAWVGRRDDSLFLGPPGSGKTGVPGDGLLSLGWNRGPRRRVFVAGVESHIAQAIGHAVIQQGYRVLYRDAHKLLKELADATLDGKRKEHMDLITTVALLIIDDLGMRKLPLTAAEQLLEIIMRRYQRASTLLTSNRPVEDWGKLLGDSAAVSAMLDRLLHHGHVLKCGPRSWRTKTSNPGQSQ